MEREPEDQKHTGNFSHECLIFVHNIVFLTQNNVINPLRKNRQMSKYLRLKLEKRERQPSLLVKTSTRKYLFSPYTSNKNYPSISASPQKIREERSFEGRRRLNCYSKVLHLNNLNANKIFSSLNMCRSHDNNKVLSSNLLVQRGTKRMNLSFEFLKSLQIFYAVALVYTVWITFFHISLPSGLIT